MLLNKKVFALHRAAYVGADRPYINGVSIQTDGSGVATDGALLVKWTPAYVEDPKEYPVVDGVNPISDVSLIPFTLERETCQKIEKSIPRRTTLPILSQVALDVAQTNQGGTAFMAVTDLQTPQIFRARKINQIDEGGLEDNAFPQYERVIPTAEPAVTISFNLANLKRLIDTLQALGLEHATFEFHDAESAAKVTGKNGDGSALAVIMPFRTR